MEIYVDGCNNRKFGACATVVGVHENIKYDLFREYYFLFPDLILEEIDAPVGKIVVAKIHFNDVASQQNNGAELIAMVAALRISLHNNFTYPILSDSKLIVDFWSKKMSKTVTDPEKGKYIQECISLHKEFESKGGVIRWIPGDLNMSDIGLHINKKVR